MEVTHDRLPIQVNIQGTQPVLQLSGHNASTSLFVISFVWNCGSKGDRSRRDDVGLGGDGSRQTIHPSRQVPFFRLIFQGLIMCICICTSYVGLVGGLGSIGYWDSPPPQTETVTVTSPVGRPALVATMLYSASSPSRNALLDFIGTIVRVRAPMGLKVASQVLVVMPRPLQQPVLIALAATRWWFRLGNNGPTQACCPRFRQVTRFRPSSLLDMRVGLSSVDAQSSLVEWHNY